MDRGESIFQRNFRVHNYPLHLFLEAPCYRVFNDFIYCNDLNIMSVSARLYVYT